MPIICIVLYVFIAISENLGAKYSTIKHLAGWIMPAFSHSLSIFCAKNFRTEEKSTINIYRYLGGTVFECVCIYDVDSVSDVAPFTHKLHPATQ